MMDNPMIVQAEHLLPGAVCPVVLLVRFHEHDEVMILQCGVTGKHTEHVCAIGGDPVASVRWLDSGAKPIDG